VICYDDTSKHKQRVNEMNKHEQRAYEFYMQRAINARLRAMNECAFDRVIQRECINDAINNIHACKRVRMSSRVRNICVQS